MRFVFAVVALLAGLLLDGLISRLGLPGGSPSALLVILVALAVSYGPKAGAYAGFVAGLAVDLVPPGGPVLGRAALVLCLIGYVAGTAHRLPSRRTVTLFLVAVASVASPLLSATVSEILGAAVPWGAVAGLLPTTLAYNVVLALVVGLLFLRIARRLEPRSYRPTRYASVPRATFTPARSAGRR